MLNHPLTLISDPGEDYISYNKHTASYTVAFILSALGIFYIMFTLVVLKLYQNTLSRMIFFISFSDLLVNVTMVTLYSLTDSELSETKCKIFVGFGHYAVLTSFSWATCFTHAFYKIAKERSDTSISQNMIYYILISFLLPVPLGILAIKWHFVDYDIQQQPFCYHKLVYGRLDKSFFYTENLPFAIALLLSFYFCFSSIRILRSIEEFSYRWKYLYILQFPLILVICWLGQQFNVICVQLDIHLKYGKEISSFFQTLIYMQGFINAIAYGVSYRVVSGYKEFCRKRCQNRRDVGGSEISDIVNSMGVSNNDALQEELLERAIRKQTTGVKSIVSGVEGSPYTMTTQTHSS